MKLNLQTDYALRLLMHLAVNEDSLVTIAEVAKRYDISKNHLMKVAHILGKEGVIDTVRGRSGGLRLAAPSSAINVGRVVRLMEADLALVECFQGPDGGCAITPACRLKHILNKALNAFLDVLDQYTVEDLVQRNDALKKLLFKEVA
ncbi:MAG: Rrf2 family transcriptional regulator [Pseudomonadota bacterium]